jgi:ABC-type branched-subunit amino acid transport system substrate-binding protein
MPRSLPALLLGIVALLSQACPPDDGSVAPPTVDLRGKTVGDLAARQEPVIKPTTDGAEPTPSSEEVQVCVLLPSSGSSEEEGAEMRRGMSIAQAQVKAEKWRKRKISWIEKDTKSTEAGAVAAYHECMVQGTPIIIGPVHPAAVTAIIPIAAAHKVVLIIPDLGAAQASRWNDNLFAITPPATDMGRVAAHNARVVRGMGRAIVLHTPEIFGESLARAFIKGFKADRDGKVVATLALSPKTPDAWVSAAIETAIKNEADSLFVVAPGEVAAAIARALNSEPLSNTQAWFIDWAMYPTVLEAAGKAIQRVHWVNRPLPRGDFEDIFLSRYQAYPNFSAGSGYDSVLLAATAIQDGESMGPAHLAIAAGSASNLSGAFGTGSMVEQAGITSEDAAGYRPVEPTREPDSETWIFSGY